jgi:protein TonB
MLTFEEEIIPITMQEKPVVPVPVEAKAITETIEIVEDDAEIEETMIMSDEDMGEVVEIQNIENVVVEEPEKEEEIFQVVENMPEFPGGMAELMKYLQKNIKYPTISQENGVQGRVIVQFVVNRDGSIVDPVVLRSVDPYLDKEALRVVSTMPKWKPGEQRGKPVRVKFTLPVQFRLQ